MSALRQFGPGIWIAEGPRVRFMGLPFPTRMIVIRLRDESLWINSPVTLSQADMAELHHIGTVRHLVAPTPMHVWRLDEWRTRFPNALAWTPENLRDSAPPEWAQDIDQLAFRGSRAICEWEFYHHQSRTLVMADFLQQHSPEPGRPIVNALTRLSGVRTLGVPIDIRLTFAGKHAQGRQSLERLLEWDFDNLIIAHGDCIAGGAKPLVRAAFRWLL